MMTSEPEKYLHEVLHELQAWPYERLKSLREARFSREIELADGQQATVHAEVLEQFVQDGIEQLLIPVEIWVGKDVIWVHLIGRSSGDHQVDMTPRTNPK